MSESEIAEISASMAAYINSETQQLLAENKQVLEHLKQAGYPMVLVSNFYGNINQVLKDAGIDGYFSRVIESAVVGVRKPNPAIHCGSRGCNGKRRNTMRVCLTGF